MQLAQRVFAGFINLYTFVDARARTLTRARAGLAAIAVVILGATIFIGIKRYLRAKPLPQPFRNNARAPMVRGRDPNAGTDREAERSQKAKESAPSPRRHAG